MASTDTPPASATGFDLAAGIVRTRAASRRLGLATHEQRAAVLGELARLLRERAGEVLEANAHDLARGEEEGLGAALLDRLRLDEGRVEDMAAAVEEIAALPDPLGEVLERREIEPGLELERVRVPFGVICVVYEARPNVTTDAAAIAIATGNAIVLRGSRQASATNAALVQLVHAALAAHELPPEAVWDFPAADRDAFRQLIATEGSLDMVVPRGGERLKAFLYEHARVPVLAAAGGNCHVYVDESADKDMAREILLNAKTQRPGVCNAAETLLVHEARAHDLLPYLVAHLEGAGVEVTGGSEEALATEYLDLKMAVTTVTGVEEAIEHVNRYGTGHSEAIVTQDAESAERFVRGVDAAAVYVNASTRFTDGGVYGLGAEVGISTSKLHARGPMGLRELTTTKYVVRGDGHVRT